jgi:hypothetical protein
MMALAPASFFKIGKDALVGVRYAVSGYNSAGESSPSNTAYLPD